MRTALLVFAAAIVFVLTVAAPVHAQSTASSSMWVSAYYAGWMQGYANDGYLPAQNIDYSALTHVMHFALAPLSDGSIDWQSPGLNEGNSRALVSRAHAAGKKVIVTVGGAGSRDGFVSAASSWNRATFVRNLVTFMVSRGYDGIDIDWEPIGAGDAPLFQALARELRAAMDAVSPRYELTTAMLLDASFVLPVADKFNQINIMTYDLSGAWEGWVTWHNSATMSGGKTFPGTSRLLPSNQSVSSDFMAGGIAASKLGVGIDFYGYVWSGGSGTPTGGVSAPNQPWTAAPSVQANVPYSTIMKDYYKQQYYRWDSAAQTSYLSIDQPGSADDKFISYDDEKTCRQKIAYVKSKGMGGVIIWELGGGYLKGAAVPSPLLDAVKQAAFPAQRLAVPAAPALASLPNLTRDVSRRPALAWNAVIGATYRVQVATNPMFTSTVVDKAGLTENAYQFTASLNPNTTYYWRVNASNTAGTGAWSSVWSFTTGIESGTTGVGDSNPGVPTSFTLEQNYPNPFNPSTVIRYTVTASARVVLEVYTMLGQKVSTLVDETQEAGTHDAQFMADELASGTYIYRVTITPESGGAPLTETKKMQLLR